MAPAFAALLIEQVGGADGDVFVALTMRVQQAVLADYDCAGVAENWKLAVDFFVPDQMRVFLIVDTDGGQASVKRVEVRLVLRELAQLVYTERSPVATVED